MLATGRIVVGAWCVSYREGLWIHGVLATGRIVVDTGCVSNREDCGGCLVC